MSAEKNTQTLHGRMRTLLSYLETPVLIVSGAYKTAYVNPAFEQAFKVSFRETLGKDPASYLIPSTAEMLVEVGEDVKNKGQPSRFMLRESNRHFSVGISPIHDDENRVTGLVYNFTDVTRERQLEQVKADFISTLLNDLRSPLIDISSSFGRIKSGLGMASPLKNILETGIERTQEVMSHLEKLLYISDSISGQLQLTKTATNAGMLTFSAIAALKNLTKKSDAMVELFVKKGLPAWQCDGDKMLQVLICLLTEQIKAAGQNGTVSVGIEAVYDGDRPQQIVISMSQPKKALDRADMPEFFTEIQGAESNDPTRLAVAAIIKAHGGVLSLVGMEGHGCAFTAAFPI